MYNFFIQICRFKDDDMLYVIKMKQNIRDNEDLNKSIFYAFLTNYLRCVSNPQSPITKINLTKITFLIFFKYFKLFSKLNIQYVNLFLNFYFS